jgi:hypothetical protein
MATQKQCNICNTTKAITNFEKLKTSYRNQCKECRKMKKKENDAKALEQVVNIDTSNMKKECITCNVNKPIDHYEKYGVHYRHECKECRKQRRNNSLENCPNAEHPEKPPSTHICTQCKRGPDEVKFQWRKDTCNGNWRTICYECKNRK